MSDQPGLAPDDDTERRVADWLAHGPDELPDHVLQEVILQTAVTPQVRRRFLGRWLDRDEGVGGRASAPWPRGEARRHVPMSLAAVVAALALVAVAVPLTRPESDAPTAGRELVVAANGAGEFLTVQEAVAAAPPGSLVRVKAGRYEGPISLDKDLSLVGDGGRGSVVITAPASSVAAGTELAGWGRHEPDRPHVLLLGGSTVTVSDLTIETPLGGTGLEAIGGSPLIERVSIVHSGRDPLDDDIYSMGFYGLVTPTVRDSEWDGYVAVRDGAAVTFEGNTVSRGGLSIDGPGVTYVRANTFVDGAWVNTTAAISTVEGNTFEGGNVTADVGSEISIRHNTFRSLRSPEGEFAIEARDAGTRAVIAANVVEDAAKGVWIGTGVAAEVSGNQLSTSVTGINTSGSGNVALDGNTITGEGAGIIVVSGSAPTITDNTIEVTGRGIVISGDASPTIDGNDICGGKGDIYLWEGAAPDLGENDLCGEDSLG